jgi:hypothetical protein
MAEIRKLQVLIQIWSAVLGDSLQQVQYSKYLRTNALWNTEGMGEKHKI